MMSIKRIAGVVLRQFYLLHGSLSRILSIFIWVGIDMILWGFLTRYLNTVGQPGFNFIPALLGAVLLWDFFIRIMQGVTMAFFEDVWSRNFLNIFATPLLISEYLGGLIITSIVTSFAAVCVMLALAIGVFHLSFLIYGMMIVPFLLILFLFGIALGIVGCSVVLRFGPSAEWFIWPIPAMVSPFAGVLYPIATLPPWMQAISHLLPPSYVFEGLRTILAGGHPSLSLLAGAGALAIIYIFLACIFFKKTYERAVKTGLIARYSAENCH